MRVRQQFALLVAGFTVPGAALIAFGNPIPFADNIDVYHLGEADPGAMAGNTGNATTVDSGPGVHNASRDGTPTYSSNVAAPGSTLSVAFNGTSDDYLVGTQLTSATNFVGVDAYIYPTSHTIVADIAYNGDSGANGFGLYQFNAANDTGNTAHIIGLLGGVALGNGVDIPLNTWTEVTQFIANGQSVLYVNGVATATTNAPQIQRAASSESPDTNVSIFQAVSTRSRSSHLSQQPPGFSAWVS